MTTPRRLPLGRQIVLAARAAWIGVAANWHAGRMAHHRHRLDALGLRNAAIAKETR